MLSLICYFKLRIVQTLYICSLISCCYFIMELSVISFNKGHSRYCKKKSNIFVLQRNEGRFLFFYKNPTSSEDVPFWKNQWGDDLWLAHGTNHSAGVIILKGSFRGKILYNQCDVKGHWVILVIEIGSNMFIYVMFLDIILLF